MKKKDRKMRQNLWIWSSQPVSQKRCAANSDWISVGKSLNTFPAQFVSRPAGSPDSGLVARLQVSLVLWLGPIGLSLAFISLAAVIMIR